MSLVFQNHLGELGKEERLAFNERVSIYIKENSCNFHVTFKLFINIRKKSSFFRWRSDWSLSRVNNNKRVSMDQWIRPNIDDWSSCGQARIHRDIQTYADQWIFQPTGFFFFFFHNYTNYSNSKLKELPKYGMVCYNRTFLTNLKIKYISCVYIYR